jgi:hypothetical protein
VIVLERCNPPHPLGLKNETVEPRQIPPARNDIGARAGGKDPQELI